MKRAFSRGVSLFTVMVMGAFMFGTHAYALSVNTDSGMGMSSHEQSPLGCATLCATATAGKEDTPGKVAKDTEEKDSKNIRHYAQQSLVGIAEEHTYRAKLAVIFEPPPGLPAYIFLSVFRT